MIPLIQPNKLFYGTIHDLSSWAVSPRRISFYVCKSRLGGQTGRRWTSNAIDFQEYPRGSLSFSSGGVQDLVDFCKQFTDKLNQHDYSILGSQELDIVIPELKIAIEFNGSFWHNSDVKDKFYHYRKTQRCLQKGYRLIHIWEDEWDNNLIQNKLKNVLIQSEISPILYNNFILDLSWFSPIETRDYDIQFIEPEIKIRNDYAVYDCGSLKYVKR